MKRVHIPPCHRPGTTPNLCARHWYDRNLYGRQDLTGPWSGWRLTEREIITPERDRMPRYLLRFLIAREKRSPGAGVGPTIDGVKALCPACKAARPTRG